VATTPILPRPKSHVSQVLAWQRPGRADTNTIIHSHCGSAQTSHGPGVAEGQLKATANSTTTVTGRISRANDRGVILDGETEWRNISKFADGCPAPQAFDGGEVTLTLDPQGYIREIAEAALSPSLTAPAATAEPMPTAVPVKPLASEVQVNTEPLGRDALIARHVALKASVELLAADITTDSDPELAISLAAAFEEWLTRK